MPSTLGTAARAVKPEEVDALRRESDRLLKLEQNLSERESALQLQHEQMLKWEEKLASQPPPPDELRTLNELVSRLRGDNSDLRAQLDVAQMGGGAPGRDSHRRARRGGGRGGGHRGGGGGGSESGGGGGGGAVGAAERGGGGGACGAAGRPRARGAAP